MKVAFYLFFPGGGIGRYTRELASELASREEVEVEIACPPDFSWRDETGYEVWPGLAALSHPNSVARRFRFLKGQLVSPLRFVSHARRSRPDVLHFSNVNHLTLPLWERAVQGLRAPVAISVHDVRRAKSILSRGWEDWQLRRAYRSADALFVHSSYQAHELVSWAGVSEDRVHVVPHGTYPHTGQTRSRRESRERLGLPADAVISLFFGQLRDEKNLDRFIRALAIARTNVHLVVAGQSASRHRNAQYYRNVAANAGILNRVSFVDRFVEEDEVGDFFSASDWVAIPYRSTFTSQSGVLNVAAYYERPVLVSSAPVLSETVKACDIGVVCSGDSDRELAGGIEKICSRLENGYRPAFEEYKRTFSWRENADRTLQVYRSLTSPRGNVRVEGKRR